MKSGGKLRRRVGSVLRGLVAGEQVAATEEILSVDFPAELSRREIRVFVPAGGVQAETPLVLALDGQMMPAWRLAEAIDAVAREKRRVAPLVVAIPASTERIEEYGMAARLDYAGRGRKAAVFQRFVLEGVMPAARERYGLRASRQHTGVFGASLGGLAALDLAWGHSDVFGFVGVFSGSLWWRGDDSSVATQQSSRLMHEQVRTTVRIPTLRCWFEAGTADETDDRDGNGVIDAIQDTTELIDELVAKGFRRGADVVYREISGGRHHESTWADALPEFFEWALPSR